MGAQPLEAPHPLSAGQVLDLYFLEARAQLLSLAATLDRVDRAPDSAAVAGDSRLAFIQKALAILESAETNRAARIQMLYSLK